MKKFLSRKIRKMLPEINSIPSLASEINQLKQNIAEISFSFESQKETQISNRESQSQFTMSAALERLAKRDINIETVIDIGASDGHWTLECRKNFPSAKYFLIEAQECHNKALKHLKDNYQNINYVQCAAGAENGEIFFDVSTPFGGVASYTDFDGAKRTRVVTVDNCVNDYNLASPYLIKLDTHGFEVPILQGAIETLKKTNAIIIEVYNFDITPEVLKFYDMCKYLERFGFRPIDIADPMLRAFDEGFWQMDIIFLKSDSPQFNYNSYN